MLVSLRECPKCHLDVWRVDYIPEWRRKWIQCEWTCVHCGIVAYGSGRGCRKSFIPERADFDTTDPNYLWIPGLSDVLDAEPGASSLGRDTA